MKKAILEIIITIIFVLSISLICKASNLSDYHLFEFDRTKMETAFNDLTQLEQLLSVDNFNDENQQFCEGFLSGSVTLQQANSLYSGNKAQILAPGRIPSFWWAFTISAIGTYTLYGAGLGPVAVGIVYLSTHGDKVETKKAAWGCLAGLVVGGGIRFAQMTL
jgi:hypothetical protein